MISSLVSICRSNSIFQWFRQTIQQHVDFTKHKTSYWQAKNPYFKDPPYSTYDSPYPVTIGIIQSFLETHRHYISACRELNVSYRLVRIDQPDWVEQILGMECDVFVVWPDEVLSQWKDMFDERLRFISRELGKSLYPNFESLWLYESKRRMNYWYKTNRIPHVKTWIFYQEDEAIAFSQNCELPIVLKTNLGSGGNGVHILKSRKELRALVLQCFRKGLSNFQRGPWDRESGFVCLQAYIPHAKEWRCLRVGDSFFAHQKISDKQSASDLVSWYDPPHALLEFFAQITQKFGFTSLDMDIFEPVEGTFLVNEIQAVFGAYRPYQMLVNGVPGRYLRSSGGTWTFDEGLFCQNGCCNLRVVDILSRKGHEVPLCSDYTDSDVTEVDKKNSIACYRGVTVAPVNDLELPPRV